MDDAKIGHDIRERAYELLRGNRGPVPSDAALGRAAREVLAKPVATREAVRQFWISDAVAQAVWKGEPSAVVIDCVLDAISHFAPPVRKSMIEGMSMEDIAAEFRNSWHSPDRPATDQWYSQHVARVAHRLANTPAPEVDADAGAKEIAARFAKATELGAQITPWEDMHEALRNGWRAVAAMKEAGGE